jgi:hypothetical protein
MKMHKTCEKLIGRQKKIAIDKSNILQAKKEFIQVALQILLKQMIKKCIPLPQSWNL